jgi:hypothetical protein
MTKKKVAVKYDPAWIEQIEEMGRSGLVLSNYASTLNLTVAELEAAAKAKKDLKDAIELAMSLALGFHTERLINPPPGSQAQLTLSFLKAHWPSIYAVDNKANNANREIGEKSPKEQSKALQDFVINLHGLFYETAKSKFEDGQLFEDFLADRKKFQADLESGAFRVGAVYAD